MQGGVHRSQSTNNGSQYVSAEWKQSKLLKLKTYAKSATWLFGGKWVIAL